MVDLVERMVPAREAVAHARVAEVVAFDGLLIKGTSINSLPQILNTWIRVLRVAHLANRSRYCLRSAP